VINLTLAEQQFEDFLKMNPDKHPQYGMVREYMRQWESGGR